MVDDIACPGYLKGKAVLTLPNKVKAGAETVSGGGKTPTLCDGSSCIAVHSRFHSVLPSQYVKFVASVARLRDHSPAIRIPTKRTLPGRIGLSASVTGRDNGIDLACIAIVHVDAPFMVA